MVRKTTLDNGIRVITETLPGVHSVSLGFWVENGSRHEPDSQGGVSHFIEHMLFKGTQRRSASDIARAIDSVGGVLNGFTSREYSCYYAKILGGQLPLAIDLLSDIVLNSIFDLDEVEKERKVILQEIHMQEDTPDDQIHDLFSQAFWADHPLGRSILGTRDTIDSLDRDGMLQFMAERYCGGNILICAAGDLEHERVVAQIAEAFRDVSSRSEPEICTLPAYHRQVNALSKDLEQVHICLGTWSLPQNHPRRFAAYLLNTILGGSMSSRLFQNVREHLGLAYSIYSYLNSHSDAGSLIVYAGTAPDDAAQVVALILKEFTRFKDQPVSSEELEAAKAQLKGNFLLSLESTDNCMTRLAKNEIYLGRHFRTDEVLQSFEQVTAEDVWALARELFQDQFLALQLVGQIDEAAVPLIDLALG